MSANSAHWARVEHFDSVTQCKMLHLSLGCSGGDSYLVGDEDVSWPGEGGRDQAGGPRSLVILGGRG